MKKNTPHFVVGRKMEEVIQSRISFTSLQIEIDCKWTRKQREASTYAECVLSICWRKIYICETENLTRYETCSIASSNSTLVKQYPPRIKWCPRVQTNPGGMEQLKMFQMFRRSLLQRLQEKSVVVKNMK